MQPIEIINDNNPITHDRVYPKISILSHEEYGGYIIAWIDEDEKAVKLKRYKIDGSQECTDLTGLGCSLYPCYSFDDCSHLTNNYCSADELCVDGPLECTTSEVCANNNFDYCDPDSLTCNVGIEYTNCVNSNTCSDLGVDYYCDENILNCVNEPITCTTSDDCSTAFGDAGYCDIKT